MRGWKGLNVFDRGSREAALVSHAGSAAALPNSARNFLPDAPFQGFNLVRKAKRDELALNFRDLSVSRCDVERVAPEPLMAM